MSISSPGMGQSGGFTDHSGTQSPAPNASQQPSKSQFNPLDGLISHSDTLGTFDSPHPTSDSTNPILMTPTTNIITPSRHLSESTPAELQTEIRKPILRENDTPLRRSPSVQPIAQQIGSLYPLTFAKSVSTAGTDPNVDTEEPEGAGETDESRVSAYARLDFESFTFYVQTLQVLLGRRAENGSGMVDVHLGPAKAISRKHAKIFYNFGTQRFELSVLGRNGAFVSDVFVEAGSTIPLKDGTKVQIGQIPFTFVLPSVPAGGDTETLSGQPITNPAEAITFKTDQQTSSRSASPALKRASVISETETKEALHKISDSLDHDIIPGLILEDVVSAPIDLPDAISTSANMFEAAVAPVAPSKAERKKKIKKEYKPEEIPVEYREKPPYSYSHLIATALRAHAPPTGISLSDIYKAIQDVFPYYKYCPPGWQNSVRHNLSSSKAFRKVSKEGKGWLWGIDEEYMAEKERQKKKAAAAKAKSVAAAAAAAATVNGNNEGHQNFRINSVPGSSTSIAETSAAIDSTLAAIDQQHDFVPQLNQVNQQNLPKKEKEKTIAELAREIEVQRRGSGSHYQTDYASMTRESLGNLRRESNSSSASPHPGVLSFSALKQRPSFSGSTGLEDSSTNVPPVTPSPNSIQAQLAANLSNRQRYNGAATTSGPVTTPSAISSAIPPPSASTSSLALGQSTINAAQQQGTSTPSEPTTFSASASASSSSSNGSTSTSATLAGLNLSPDTLKALAVLQRKIQGQLGATSGINAGLLTNALAIAIAQVAKTGGPNAVASLLNGKNPAQLAAVLQNALASVKKSKVGGVPVSASVSAANSGTSSPAINQKPLSQSPPPNSTSPPVESRTNTGGGSIKELLAGAKPPSIPSTTVRDASPSNLAGSKPANPLASLTGGKPPTSATIAEVLAQASKIANPSPSMQAALQQLQAHAKKLEKDKSNGGDNSNKRASDDPIELLDDTAPKSVKSGEA